MLLLAGPAKDETEFKSSAAYRLRPLSAKPSLLLWPEAVQLHNTSQCAPVYIMLGMYAGTGQNYHWEVSGATMTSLRLCWGWWIDISAMSGSALYRRSKACCIELCCWELLRIQWVSTWSGEHGSRWDVMHVSCLKKQGTLFLSSTRRDRAVLAKWEVGKLVLSISVLTWLSWYLLTESVSSELYSLLENVH